MNSTYRLPDCVIRADASARLGTGHLMRCLALAQAWREAGGGVTFLSYCESVSLREYVQSEGFRFEPLASPHPDPSDLELALRHLELLSPSGDQRPWLVLDGYHFESCYQREVLSRGYRLLVIDDIAHLPIYHADVLLNQNLRAEGFDYSCGAETIRLLGSEYVLLRSHFLGRPAGLRSLAEPATRVLVTLGGGDSNNATLQVIGALQHVGGDALEARVVVGAENPHYQTLRQAARDSRGSISLVRGSFDMAGLMAWADVAVSAAGITCWELAYMGTPTILVVTAKNQLSGARAMRDVGAACLLDSRPEALADTLPETLASLLNDPERRLRMSRRGQQLIDGRGRERVIAALLPAVGAASSA